MTKKDNNTFVTPEIPHVPRLGSMKVGTGASVVIPELMEP